MTVTAEGLCRSLDLVLLLAQDAPAPVRLVNLGGGWGIPYFPGERALDLAPVASVLAEVQMDLGRALPTARQVLE